MSTRIRRHRNRQALLAAILVAALVAGCSSSSTDAPGTAETGATGTVAAGKTVVPTMVSYFEPTNEAFTAAMEFLGDGPFTMLNLFRLRDVPDFSGYPEMEPETPMTSHELFYRYIVHMDTLLEKVGAKRIFLADSGPLLIGPSGERWDVIQMVEYPSKQAFIEFGIMVRPEVLERAVMLADSRIMPMQVQPLDEPLTVE